MLYIWPDFHMKYRYIIKAIYNNAVHYVWIRINLVGPISVLCLIQRPGHDMANTSVAIMEIRVYRVCLKCLIETSVVYHTKKKSGVGGEKGRINMRRQTLRFRGTAPTFSRPLSFRFLSVRTLKNTSVFSCDCKWRGTSPVRFWCLSNHLQPPWYLWKSPFVIICVHACGASGGGCGWHFERFV